MASNPAEIETKSKSRPLMLKDFLRDDPNSWSNDFRRSYTTVRKLLEIDLNSSEDTITERRLCRSRSKTMTTISAFQKALINVVKQFPFSGARSPPKQGILPRSLSRRLRRTSRKKKKEKENQAMRDRVSVRDIIRWKSFQEAEKKNELQLPCSISSSWGESDFATEFLRSGEMHLPDKTEGVGEDSVDTAKRHGEAEVKESKEEESGGELVCLYEEKEQLSPVSVLDFPYEDEEIETPSSSFEESLANMERTKQHLLQKIRQFECLAQMDPVDPEKCISKSELEEKAEEATQTEDKARKLLELFKASSGEIHMKKLLMDFFQEGLAASQRNYLTTTRVDAEAVEIEEELLRAANDWTNGCVGLEWGLEDNIEACIKEMGRNGRWRSFEEEKEELEMEMEIVVVGSLVEELLEDLLD